MSLDDVEQWFLWVVAIALKFVWKNSNEWPKSDEEVPCLKQVKGGGGKQHCGIDETLLVTLHILPTLVSTEMLMFIFLGFAVAL